MVPWIKITTNIFDDEKIKIIDSMPDHDAILVIWIKLLTLAGKCNKSGCLEIADSMPYTDEMLAAVFNRPLQTIRMSLSVFESLGMIERHTAIVLVNWEKHQNEAGLAIIREREAERKRIQRARQKLLIANVPDNVQDSPIDVPPLELDKEEDNKEEKPDKPAKQTFSKPTIEEVAAYCQERGNNVDAARFCDYYESTGWMVGKHKMRDWRAAVRTWERNDSTKRSDQTIKATQIDEYRREMLNRAR